jgi:hypothetical protein
MCCTSHVCGGQGGPIPASRVAIWVGPIIIKMILILLTSLADMKSRRSLTEKTAGPLTVSCDDEGETEQYILETAPGSAYSRPQSPPSPTSPFSPSPRRLRLRCTPDSTRAPEALDDSCRSSFATPSKNEKQILVEFLVFGCLRTAESSWYPNTSAWFPAELHQVHREETTKEIWAQVVFVFTFIEVGASV